MKATTQPISQMDADELVRILIVSNPAASPGRIMRLAFEEGIPPVQAQETAAKYLGWDGRKRPTRCVEHNAVLPCERCFL